MDAVILSLLSFFARQRAHIIMLRSVMRTIPGIHAEAMRHLDEFDEQTQQMLLEIEFKSMDQYVGTLIEILRKATSYDERAPKIADELEAKYKKVCATNRETRDQNWLKGALSDLEKPPPPSPPHE